MLLGVIADDYTGASDIANTLAKGYGGASLATTQYLGVPKRDAAPECEAGVVALKTRSIPADEAIAQSLAALSWLKRQGCRQFVFKYCSTFDSTPEGNIGPVGEALAAALGVKGVVACPAFPAAGRTLYQGHLFVGDRLLSESSLATHPLNPMTDADLRRWLARQCAAPVGHIPWRDVSQGSDRVREALARARDQGQVLTIVDALSEADLVAIGGACAGDLLVTGGSGVALALPLNFRRAGLPVGGSATFKPQPGPEAVLAGSCSAATLEQIARHARRHPLRHIGVDQILEGDVEALIGELAAFVREHEGQAPLIASSDTPDRVKAVQARFGAEAASHALDRFFGLLAARLVAEGVTRCVVAGGETSGAVVSALDIDAFAIGPEIAPGVPAVSTVAAPPLAMALKSGNFGEPDFFENALAVLKG
ncbi:3-oxo-tetronate kinase [Bosea sp. (in: a-proteobacteria)]|uniref:3-oxo-tetronate kinase n=1 Tax=Bosea sp. (in: a-proteobacteria) TaxID=1871050 RepID=UPI00261D5711|nr:3-oxo-tetronate kinase [Bosea sp. (in: a-proteobacteria)]MCO5090353.1 four-carbon acid sugar kinase family protein [Bosea sp. (in: a-proteobacteria)]